LSHKQSKRFVVIGIFSILIIGIILVVNISNSCDVKYSIILDDIQKYEKNLEPEFCDDLVYKILELNESCNTDIEILDCG